MLKWGRWGKRLFPAKAPSRQVAKSPSRQVAKSQSEDERKSLTTNFHLPRRGRWHGGRIDTKNFLATEKRQRKSLTTNEHEFFGR
jgi:hypothetical protein